MDDLSRILDELLPFLSRYEGWIYVALGLVAIFQLRWLVQSWHEWRNSVFGLEREIAQKRFAAPLTIIVLMSMLVLGEFLIVSFVAPSYPQYTRVATPTLDLSAMPVSATATPRAGLTPSPSALTAQPTISAPATEGCKTGTIEWLSPKADETISATMELKGVVNVPNLGFYKYEYAQAGSDKWTTIAAGSTPLVSGTIGFWNTNQLAVGDYLLRLVVADNQNQLFPACVIRVRVSKP